MRLPFPLSWLWEKWKAVAHVIGKVMSTIILTVMWVVCFGLYAIFLKLFGRKQKEAQSYWKSTSEEPASDFRYQF